MQYEPEFDSDVDSEEDPEEDGSQGRDDEDEECESSSSGKRRHRVREFNASLLCSISRLNSWAVFRRRSPKW